MLLSHMFTTIHHGVTVQWNCCLLLVISCKPPSLVARSMFLPSPTLFCDAGRTPSRWHLPPTQGWPPTPTNSNDSLNFRVPMLRGKLIIPSYTNKHHQQSSGIITVCFSPPPQSSSGRVTQSCFVWSISRPSGTSISSGWDLCVVHEYSF